MPNRKNRGLLFVVVTATAAVWWLCPCGGSTSHAHFAAAPQQPDLTDARLFQILRELDNSQSNSNSNYPLLADSLIRPFWDAWQAKHGLTFQDDHRRLNVFVENARSVALHNAAYESDFTLYQQTVMNSPFAHLTNEEFAATHLMGSQNCSATHRNSNLRQDFVLPPPQDLPAFVDWRARGIMTPVKNQKHCGSCWTFSTSGTLEAHTCLHRRSVDCPTWSGLAEQQLLDCARDYDNHGCNGGLPSHAFEYLKHASGMAAEDDYPYLAQDSHTCHIHDDDENNQQFRATVAAVYNISNRDEDDLVASIAHLGPVAIAYQVAEDFRFYQHGVYDSYNATTNTTICSDDNMSVNHAVVAVGYGVTEEGVPYYIVRNSWSVNWGMEGHFWMLRGKNLCGVSDCASFPIVPESLHLLRENSKDVGVGGGGLHSSNSIAEPL